MNVDLSQQAMMLGRSVQDLSNGWFSPGVPMRPMAPADFGWIRSLDYDIGTNVNITPKASDKGLTYRQLRNLAESNDYVAIAIQTVLDRLCATEGRVVDVGGDPRKPSKRADEINDWARCMDGVTPLSEFLQSAAYDMCVIDAPSVAVDVTNPTAPIAYNLDGASVVAHLNERGRVASFGQVIKGQIAHEYFQNEGDFRIVWMPKNRRPHKTYGYSPLEQIQNIVTVSLMRLARQIDWFTKGNVPDVLFVAPEGWQPSQIKDINRDWEKQLAGISGKGKGRWIPPGTKVETLDRNPVSGEFDEWLIRTIFSAYSLPPTPFVKQVNRATSESMQDASVEEGHASVLRWAANFLTATITAAWGEGFKWEWNLAKPTKAETIALLAAGVLKPQAATRLGFELDEIAEQLPNAAKLDPAKEIKPEAEKIEAKPKPKKVSNADEADVEALEATVQEYLDLLRERALVAAENAFHGRESELDPTPPKGFALRAETNIAEIAKAGAQFASTKTRLRPERLAPVKAEAEAYAKERAAELVGMRVTESGKIIPNPNAQWQISDMAREAIRDSVERAFEEHLTPSNLSEIISQDRAFAPRRALNIARTETATAQEAGSLAYYKAAGVPRKKWSDHDGCPICKANAAQGPIKIGEAFQSGHQHAPAHPACRCTIIPVEDEE